MQTHTFTCPSLDSPRNRPWDKDLHVSHFLREDTGRGVWWWLWGGRGGTLARGCHQASILVPTRVHSCRANFGSQYEIHASEFPAERWRTWDMFTATPFYSRGVLIGYQYEPATQVTKWPLAVRGRSTGAGRWESGMHTHVVRVRGWRWGSNIVSYGLFVYVYGTCTHMNYTLIFSCL